MKQLTFLSLIFFVTTSSLSSQVPQNLSYQGLLTDTNGEAMNGNFDLTFKLYTVSAAGTSLWDETQTVTVSDGLFNVILGSINPLTLPFDRAYWLGITISGGSELEPRIQLASSAYSLIARSIVDSAVTSSKIADGAVTTPKLNTTGASVGQALMFNGSNVAWDKPSAAGLNLPFEATTALPSSQFDPNWAFSVTNTGSGIALRGRAKTMAIQGIATDTGDVTNYGGYFEAHGTKGYAVAGIVGSSAEAGGVYGFAQGNGTGVFGESTGGGAGIFGKSASGSGVYGSSSGSGNGVRGSSNGTGAGVSGISLTAPGVKGFSGGYGVEGSSTNSYGGFFSGLGNDHLDLALGGAIGRINTDPGNENSQLYLSSNADVIIKLDNDGGEDGVFRLKNSGGTDVVKIDEAGKTTTKVLEITGGSDLSEQFDVDASQHIQPGIVVSIDPQNPGKLVISNEAYDHKVAGIISGAGGVKPGMLMSQSGTLADGKHPVALTGRVYCLADASHEPIRTGDLLTTSDTPGHAMKVGDFPKAQGAIIGKAMTPLDEGKGLVLVLVTLQ